MTEAHRELALRILKEHRDEIAKKVVEQSARTAPGMNLIDRRARIESIKRLLDGLHESLRTGDEDIVVGMAREMADLRKASGVDWRALASASHCYMPVVRRVMVAHARDPLEGLAAFESIEGPGLEIVVASMLATLPEEFNLADFAPIDDEGDATDPQRPRFDFLPFS
jgi:hypothetical protein